MSNLIGRQVTIDEWKNDFKGYINALNLPKDDYNGIMEYIDELPSAQPVDKDINVPNTDTIYRQSAIDEIEYELEMINSALDSITLDFNARERLRQRRGEAREILNSIQQLPSAQQERKKGTWRHYEGMLTCSVCGAEFYDDIMEYFGDDVPRFCPDCGSDMRGEDHAV